MAISFPVSFIDPYQLLNSGDSYPSLSDYDYRFLCEGDSWFSMGAVFSPLTTNILLELELPVRGCVINCAHPGDLLTHMVKWRKNPVFERLLSGVQAEQWSAILLSAGGNDLIDAVQVYSFFADGRPVPRHQRLLLTEQEWGNGTDPSRYLSDEGWSTFREHMTLQYMALIERRDDRSSPNKFVPTFFHLYDYPTPRNAPAGTFPKQVGPWLYPALQAYAIPKTDWIPLARRLIDRFAEFVASALTLLPACHVVDTRGTLVPAGMHTSGLSNDWQNEIHPTKSGYQKIAQLYSYKMADVLGLTPWREVSVPFPEQLLTGNLNSSRHGPSVHALVSASGIRYS